MRPAIDQLDLSPMYKEIWKDIEKDIKFFSDYKFYELILLSNRVAYFKDYSEYSYWLHICYPRKLYKDINIDFYKKTYLNKIGYNKFKNNKCLNCKYELTKQEQIMLKLIDLGNKI